MSSLLAAAPSLTLEGWALVGLCACGAIGLAVAVALRASWLRRPRAQEPANAAPGRDRASAVARRSTSKTSPERDALTGLASRAEFDVALEEAVWRAEHRGGAPVAVAQVGVDDLRSVNDGFGQSAGDEVLVMLAERLATLPGAAPAVTPTLVARVGGDAFALLLAADEPGAIAMAAHLCATVARPSTRGAQPAAAAPVAVTVSVGVACYPAHGAWSRLLPHAATAMRHVQRCGGNGHAVFSQAMAVDLREQALLLQDLRLAAERGELRLVYQPKIDAASLQITAAEALLRWEHPVRGLVPPTVFIPLAERHGLIAALGDWVIAEACRQAAIWRDAGLRMRIAINISGYQLRRDGFVAALQAQAHQHRIPPSRLTCEITESVAMEDTAATRAAFQRLRRAGFHVSIDDFGTGHSSLAVLRRLPAAELKVDRHFVVDLEVSESARSIVEAVLSVARTLGMRVVAEGVETEGQRDILVQMGCDELQGYLFARPMSAAALAMWAEGGAPGDGGGAAATFRPSLFDATRPAPIES